MKKRMVSFFIFVILFVLSFVSASQSSSSNYGTDIIFSEGGGNTSSATYRSGISAGIVSGGLSSSSYSQVSGFFIIPEEGGSEETPTTPAGGTTRGGGGGAAAQEIFTIDKTLIKTLIKQGESIREFIEIKNNLDSVLNVNIESSLKKFMVISEENFSLAPKESKIIFVDIFAKEDEIPEAYTGKITITGNSITKINKLILEIKEKKPLFDVSVDVISKKVPIDGNVKARLKVSNLGDLNNIDIYLYYAIQDFDGNILSFKEENVAIDKELTVTRTLAVPSTVSLGDYVFYFKASYENISASSTESFEIVEKEAISLFLIVLMLCVVLIFIVLIFVIASLWRLHHHIKQKEKIGLIERMKINSERRRIEKDRRRMLKEAISQKRIAEKRNYTLNEKIREEEKRKSELKEKLQKEIEKQNQGFRTSENTKKTEEKKRVEKIKKSIKEIIQRPKPERIGFFKRRKINKERRKKERESRRLLRELARQKKRAEKENRRLQKIKQREHRKHLRLQKGKQRKLEREYRRNVRREKRIERKGNLTSSEPIKSIEKSGKKEKPFSLDEDLRKQREI